MFNIKKVKFSKFLELKNYSNSHLNTFNKLVLGNILNNNNNFYYNNSVFYKNSKELDLLPKYEQKEIINDALTYSKNLLSDFVSIGSYTNSKGFTSLTNSLNEKLELRDNFKYNKDNFYVCDGCNNAFNRILSLIFHDNNDYILIPSVEKGYIKNSVELSLGNYELYDFDENTKGKIDLKNLKVKIEKLIKEKKKPKAIYISNPNNPYGYLMNYFEIKEIIDFCYKNNLVIIVDESLQQNIFLNKFNSFNKVLKKHNKNISHSVELITLFSLSFGFSNIPGYKSGFIYFNNIDEEVLDQFTKLFSMNLNSNTVGQVLLYLWANPPNIFNSSQATIDLVEKEINDFHSSEKLKFSKINSKLTSLKNIKVNDKLLNGPYLYWELNSNNKNIVKELQEKKDLYLFDGNILNHRNNKQNLQSIRINLQGNTEDILNALEILDNYLN